MVIKGSAILAVLLAVIQPSAVVFGQTSNSPNANRPISSSSVNTPQLISNPTAETGCASPPCEYPAPHITVANPAPAPVPVPAQWSLPDRIAWAANLVLALVAYIGIILAVSTLRKIERHTVATEIAAEAAADSAHAALLNAQAMIDSERPWLLITVKPSRSVENSFTVTATNRGRSPANVTSISEQIKIAIDEAHLAVPPEYPIEETGAPFVPIILLPGESAAIKTFGRDDLRGICPTEESFKRIVNWEERVFLYGRILYTDLIATAGQQTHETAWCCWYIHGNQKSGLVIAGPREYNLHS